MLKYKDYYIVFEEIPDYVSLAVNITNCQNFCKGCHSPELRANSGEELTEDIIDDLIDYNYGINCFVFMGEGKDYARVVELSKHIHAKHPGIKTAVYSGRNEAPEYFGELDFIKIGPYKEEFGPLNKETTNQKLYELGEDGEYTDVTCRFWKRK